MFTTCKRCNMPFVEEEGQEDCPLCCEEFGTNKPKETEELTPKQKVMRLEYENSTLKMKNTLLNFEKTSLEMENDRLRRGRSTVASQDHGLSEKLKHLIALCHPDKHKGSKIANDVTVWLLNQRSNLRG
jgi:uncharacterized Zn finger protein (UPF0148 family)